MSSDILYKVMIEIGFSDKLVFNTLPKYKFKDTPSFIDYLLPQEQELAEEE